jgi:hypothetical protein
MNTKDMAVDYIKRAENCLTECENAFEEDDFARTVRRAQECIELSVKSVLRAIGIEFPKEHDISDLLVTLNFKFPNWFKQKIVKIAKIMAEITPKRGPAMYGFEKELVPPSKIFSKKDGMNARKDAQFVYRYCKKFVNYWFEK